MLLKSVPVALSSFLLGSSFADSDPFAGSFRVSLFRFGVALKERTQFVILI